MRSIPMFENYDKDVYYIIYDKDDYIIVDTFKFWGKELTNKLAESDDYAWCNVTHPKSREVLDKINLMNDTYF